MRGVPRARAVATVALWHARCHGPGVFAATAGNQARAPPSGAGGWRRQPPRGIKGVHQHGLTLGGPSAGRLPGARAAGRPRWAYGGQAPRTQKRRGPGSGRDPDPKRPVNPPLLPPSPLPPPFWAQLATGDGMVWRRAGGDAVGGGRQPMRRPGDGAWWWSPQRRATAPCEARPGQRLRRRQRLVCRRAKARSRALISDMPLCI